MHDPRLVIFIGAKHNGFNDYIRRRERLSSTNRHCLVPIDILQFTGRVENIKLTMIVSSFGRKRYLNIPPDHILFAPY